MGQLSTSLTQERAQLEQKIQQTKTLLSQTEKSKQNALVRWEALQQQLDATQQLLGIYQSEIQALEYDLRKKNEELKVLQDNLAVQADRYRIFLRKMYRWKIQHPKWLYLVSSANANDFFRKWIYLNQLEDWQEQKRDSILHLTQIVQQQKSDITAQEKEHRFQLQREQATAASMKKDVMTKKRLLEELQSQSESLAKKLSHQQKQKEQLDREIAKIIERARKETTRTKAGNSVSYAKTPEGKALSSHFSANKGKLPWPVKEGIVIKHFGKQKHPSLPGITIQNNGIDIAAPAASAVYAISKGKVVGIVEVPGYQTMVLLQHGAYYTVYSRLINVQLSKDQIVQAGTQIGTAAFNTQEEQTLVHFEIWEGKKKLSPTHWLVK